jgi:hypothetical protein
VSSTLSRYDALTLSYRPVLYLDLLPGASSTAPDLAACLPGGVYVPSDSTRAGTQLPDGEPAPVFNGRTLVRVNSSPLLSIRKTGQLTVEAWIRPATLRFASTEGSGYVEWLGKGAPGQFEYALRIYSQGNSEDRGNRISGYAFNLNGGLGSGSYFQDSLTIDQWIMVTVVFATEGINGYPAESVTIFRDGHQRGTTPLSQFHVTPRMGSATFQVASLDGRSYFEGAIAKVAVFDSALPPANIAAQYRLMTQRT